MVFSFIKKTCFAPKWENPWSPPWQDDLSARVPLGTDPSFHDDPPRPRQLPLRWRNSTTSLTTIRLGNLWKEENLGRFRKSPRDFLTWQWFFDIQEFGRCILQFKHGDFPLPCELTLGEHPKVVPQNSRFPIFYVYIGGNVWGRHCQGTFFFVPTWSWKGVDVDGRNPVDGVGGDETFINNPWG